MHAVASSLPTPYNAPIMHSPMPPFSFRLYAATLLIAMGAGCAPSESPQAPDLFYLYKTIAVGKNPTSIVAGDLNGDRFADMVTTNIGDDSLSILLGNGDGNFMDAMPLRLPEQPRAVALHDFNGDNRLDLAVATTGNHRVTILMGEGTGRFIKGDSYSAVKSPVSLAVGDFNRDGKPDLAVALRNDKLLILAGRGDGSFLQKGVYEYGDTPTSVTADDVNEDGLTDLVVTHGGIMSNSVVVFLGQGDGAFRAPVPYRTGHSPLSVSALDLNRDHHVDLLVINGERDDISVFFGKGDGTFTPGASFGANAGPISAVTQDFDGDGKTDIAVANNMSSDLSLLLGQGDGTFRQPPRSYRTGAAPFAVTAVSFGPQDPRPGLVTANNLGHTVSIFVAKDPRSHPTPQH